MDKLTKEIVKNIKNDVKKRKLSKEEKLEYYNNIYQIYGWDIYDLVTPIKIQNLDIKNILKSGRFEVIYFKYGEEIYNDNISFMKAKDIEYTTGSKFLSLLYKTNMFFKKKILIPILGLSFALPTTSSAIAFMEKSEEEKENLNQIEEYIDSIEDYADSINKYNFSDIEILMKVTKDMWNNIDGYGSPEKDLRYYPGLDLYGDKKVGVCRNMADDVARKLNAINKDYNARVLYVHVSGSGYSNADIDIKFAEQDARYTQQDTDSNDVEQPETDIESEVDVSKFLGNHAIVLVDIKEYNVTLVLDPTNPGIGVLKDLKITMFNDTEKGNFIEKATPFLNYIISENLFDLSKQLLSSFRESNLSIEELEEIFGLEAQNNALLSAEEKEKTFKDTLVVDLGNNIKAVGTLNRDEQVLNLGDNENELI